VQVWEAVTVWTAACWGAFSSAAGAYYTLSLLSSGVDSAVNLTASASTVSPMNLAMPRLMGLREASGGRSPAPFAKPQVPADVTSRGGGGTWTIRSQRPAAASTGVVSKPPPTMTSPWSYPTGAPATLRPRSSTSLAGQSRRGSMGYGSSGRLDHFLGWVLWLTAWYARCMLTHEPCSDIFSDAGGRS